MQGLECHTHTRFQGSAGPGRLLKICKFTQIHDSRELSLSPTTCSQPNDARKSRHLILQPAKRGHLFGGPEFYHGAPLRQALALLRRCARPCWFPRWRSILRLLLLD